MPSGSRVRCGPHRCRGYAPHDRWRRRSYVRPSDPEADRRTGDRARRAPLKATSRSAPRSFRGRVGRDRPCHLRCSAAESFADRRDRAQTMRTDHLIENSMWSPRTTARSTVSFEFRRELDQERPRRGDEIRPAAAAKRRMVGPGRPVRSATRRSEVFRRPAPPRCAALSSGQVLRAAQLTEAQSVGLMFKRA